MSDEVHDSDRKLEDELRRLLLAIEASGRAILPSSNEELLQSIVEAAARIFGAGGASIALLDPNQEALEFKFVFGKVRDNIVGMRIPTHQGIAGFVATSGQPMAISNVQQDPHFAQDVAEKVGYMPKSILAMPLISNERVIGVIEIIDKLNAPSFGMQDMELLAIFAGQAAIAIQASQQFELLNETMVKGIQALVGNDPATRLNRVLSDPGAAPEADPRVDLMELASLFNSISQLGERERKMCLQVLSAFAEYTRSRQRYA